MSSAHRLLNLTDKDIHLLKIFESVVRAGGYTVAEACLNKSKSAISIHISSLETRLGKLLCYRGRSGFSLTPEGEQVYQICKEMFNDIDKYRERLNQVSPLVGGTLRVTMDDTIVNSRMQTLVEAFGKFNIDGHNKTFLEVTVTSPERLFQMFLDGETDICVGAIPKKIPDAKMFTLYQEELGWFCSDKHPLYGRKDSDTDSELKNFEAVDYWAYQAPELEAEMMSSHTAARSSQSMSRLLLVLSGRYIGLLPRSFAATWVATGQLREIGSPNPNLKQKYYLTARSEVASYESCARLMHELRQAFKADGEVLTQADIAKVA
ncbi:MAG: LysR family transcriptional regulator [Massilia sp.]